MKAQNRRAAIVVALLFVGIPLAGGQVFEGDSDCNVSLQMFVPRLVDQGLPSFAEAALERVAFSELI